MKEFSETIAAIATPNGAGGIGIIRLSGSDAVSISQKIFRPAHEKTFLKNLAEKKNFVSFGHIMDEKKMIDEVLLLTMFEPKSYTREDVVEIQCHGGREVLKKILALTFEKGARLAQAGEFTKRAFLNGRIDLAQAQAVMDLVSAKTDLGLKMASGRLMGKFSQRVQDVRQKILKLIAHLEATLDYPDEDLDEVIFDEAEKTLKNLQKNLNEMIASANAGKILRDGLQVAIIGKPNVGKSSLLNALLGENRAIVTDIAGTTRDSIEAEINLEGVPLCIIDTAGIRQTADVVEKIGVERARDCVKKADLVLALFDVSENLTEEDEEILKILQDEPNFFILLTKRDKISQEENIHEFKEQLHNKFVFEKNKLIEVTTKTDAGLDELKKEILKFVYQKENAFGEIHLDEGSFANSLREENLLKLAEANLEKSLCALQNQIGADFVCIDLREALENLGEITGDEVTEDIIDEIFKNFCVGK